MEIPRSIDIRYFRNPTMQQDGNKWKPARPLPFYSIFERWIRAFHVLTGRADALYWDKPNTRRKTNQQLIREAIKIGHVNSKKDFTCTKCAEQQTCRFAFDFYNTNGDCLAEK